MPENVFYLATQLFRLFIISIIFMVLFGCSSSRPAPVSEKSQNTIWRPKTYVVAPGDTLFSIAWRYGLKYENLAKHNGILPPYIIRPSQVIRLDVGATTTKKLLSPNQTKQTVISQIHSIPKSHQPLLRKENKTVSPKSFPKIIAPQSAPQWRWPSKGTILSSFQGNDGFNKGIDLGGKLGEPVLAAASGQVVYAGSGLRGYGKLLIIKHNETFLSAYAHNERLRVKEGDSVKVGQVIADMGSSGTDRIKLHFEIRRDGTPVDPLKYLPRR
ncbi:MAG TPA: peptidoglycan DD-metalloendopeptidase family protein [Cellvibrio sp.]|nr:peptidoglycan DD-metalloendopeptidase family protein [Cellvibrio sp.]